MRLNALGRASMNNPARAWLQRRLMARWFERLGGRVPGGRGLEVGCGRGAMLPVLRERFGLSDILGLDLDPRMLALARRGGRPPASGRLVVGDVTRAPLPDGSVDAVFDFGAIHFVADWPRALDEVRRLLAPGGRYYFEWVTSRFLRAFYPLATSGFESMSAPSPSDLLRALEARGIRVGNRFVEPRTAAALTWLVGDVVGVGTVA